MLQFSYILRLRFQFDAFCPLHYFCNGGFSFIKRKFGFIFVIRCNFSEIAVVCKMKRVF